MLANIYRQSLLISFGVLVFAGSSSALPSIGLTATKSAAGRTLTLAVTTSEDASSCTYTIRAAESVSKLANGQVVTRAAGSASTVSLSATGLRALRKGRASSLFLRAFAACPGGDAQSSVIRYRPNLSNSSNLDTVAKWIVQLRGRLLLSQVSRDEAFPNLSFSLPIDFQVAGDSSGRIFIAEQGGHVQSFDNNPAVSSKTLYLDISDRIASGGELGLLGLAFHPDFASNGYVYVNYTASGGGDTKISRFQAIPPSATTISASTEQVMLTVAQPFGNHNGGAITFGADGFLYIALGDGGGSGDPLGNGQDRTSVLGKILRIDVDTPSGSNQYSSPATNPFFGNSSGFREEIYAYGFRNPWRITFDRETGLLWAGDVGQDKFEEIDIVERGGNYGWKRMEGFSCFSPATGCNKSGLKLPILDYRHSLGRSITGGYVYRGQSEPALTGLYLYGDFISGRIWALDKRGRTVNNFNLFDTDDNISTFGRDENGDIYVVSYSDGKIYKFN